MPRARHTHRVAEPARLAGPVGRQPCNQCFVNVASVASTVSVEDYVHDALHFVELDLVEGAGHLDIRVACPLDRDGYVRGTKINQLQAVVAKVAVVMCLDVASPAIRCLELPLNDEIGAIQPRRISGVIAGIFGLERKLVIVTCFSRGDVFCVKSHETSFPGLPRDHSRRSNPYRPAPAASRGFLRRGLSDTCRPVASAQSVFGRPSIILNECDGSGQPIRLPLLWVESGSLPSH